MYTNIWANCMRNYIIYTNMYVIFSYYTNK